MKKRRSRAVIPAPRRKLPHSNLEQRTNQLLMLAREFERRLDNMAMQNERLDLRIHNLAEQINELRMRFDSIEDIKNLERLAEVARMRAEHAVILANEASDKRNYEDRFVTTNYFHNWLHRIQVELKKVTDRVNSDEAQ